MGAESEQDGRQLHKTSDRPPLGGVCVCVCVDSEDKVDTVAEALLL